ncbi:MAG TPA: DUF922 domain-containing protein [Chitinophagaceae bacterium]|jgi:predicted secreted Zn-dependent protease|nr:DUF922 domain-containing protein [Chitinophagaceae bacterium]
MLLLKKYLWIISLAFPFALYAQDRNEQLIKWEMGRNLTWNDYYGKPDPASDAAASTATYLGIEYSLSNDNFKYKITCSFSKNKSWVRYKNDFVLSHEQGHFDITEIFARKLNKVMCEYHFNRNTYRKDLDKIYQDILHEKDSMQDQYDHETNFSRNKEKQIAWLKKIERMLGELKEFAHYKDPFSST